ncbi:MAG: Fur family transcriptional regulator [Bacteroidota bacterium]
MDNAKEPSKDKGAIVKKVFVDFLTSNGHKITTERLTILASIYEMDNHFDLVELHYHLRQDGHHISQATIYNNIKLFERAGLIIKHRFGLGKAKYERCYFRGNHHHIIFMDTGEVKAFKDPRIREIQQMIEETYGIKVDKHSLYFYGRRCEKKEISST